jgi:cell division protein FtsI/penicillin-binding protein 2
MPGSSEADRKTALRAWFARHADRGLPSEWLQDVQGIAIDEAPSEEDHLVDKARVSYVAGLLQHERRGLAGFEAAFDATLRGRQGLRLVERDRARREQRLWSHLRVDAGGDVRLTFDLDLQLAAERVVHRTVADMVARYDDAGDRQRVEAALAVIDARSGDVLALAGAPLHGEGPAHLPGVHWGGNGSIGSVAKPFLLVEQLAAERAGRAHLPLAQFAECDGKFAYGGTVLRCSHTPHWNVGRDPIESIAESCNEFFYQVGAGLGRDGVLRALRRFGLARPGETDDPFAVCWQGKVEGLVVALPSLDLGQLDPRLAIGYGVQATPLHVARAYAAFATGSLPTLGVLPGPRARVALHDVVGDLAFAEDGLRRCVTHGTAEKVALLAELGVLGKTGTAEIGGQGQNNAWFAGYLPFAGSDGVQLCFCAVVYWVPDGVHGAECGGGVVGDLLAAMRDDGALHARYLVPEGGR